MKKMTKGELIKRDQDRNIGEEVLQAIRDISAGKIGRIWGVELQESAMQVFAEVPANNSQASSRVLPTAKE